MNESLTTKDELVTIRKWAAGRKALVEIGVCWGGTSKVIREAMSPEGMLYLIDPFVKLPMTWNGKRVYDDEEIAKKNVESVNNGHVSWIKDFSDNAAKNFAGEIDFLFIDGDHERPQPRKDFDNFSPLIKKGGVLLFHDVADYHPPVVEAFNVAIESGKWNLVDRCGSVRVLERK
jgi:predicted O-methyltransferase YrrM